jgi:hypothetical protein
MNIEETLAYSEAYASGIALAAELPVDEGEERAVNEKAHIGVPTLLYQQLAGVYLQRHFDAPPALRTQRVRALFDGFCQGLLERWGRNDLVFLEAGYFGDTVLYLRRSGERWEGRVFHGGDCPWHPRSEAPFVLMDTPSELVDALFYYGPHGSHYVAEGEEDVA